MAALTAESTRVLVVLTALVALTLALSAALVVVSMMQGSEGSMPPGSGDSVPILALVASVA
jgi:hypothetical protein